MRAKSLETIASAVHSYLAKAFVPVNSRFAEMEKRLDAMERSVSEFRYKGVHEPGRTYVENNCVTVGGSMWTCVVKQTTQRPGDGGDWQLSVKRGKDAIR